MLCMIIETTHVYFLDVFLCTNYREYHANRDKRKRRIFSSGNEKNDLKTDPDRSFKLILCHQEKLSLNCIPKVHEQTEKSPNLTNFVWFLWKICEHCALIVNHCNKNWVKILGFVSNWSGIYVVTWKSFKNW